LPRAYTVATIGVALEVDPKWIDNVLSHFAISGVVSARQGVARKISATGVLELSLVHKLSKSLNVPIELAVESAKTLAEQEEIAIGGGGLSLRLDKNRELAELQTHLEFAVESTPIPRRGRPPGKTKRGA
jgi:hypothetical protein